MCERATTVLDLVRETTDTCRVRIDTAGVSPSLQDLSSHFLFLFYLVERQKSFFFQSHLIALADSFEFGKRNLKVTRAYESFWWLNALVRNYTEIPASVSRLLWRLEMERGAASREREREREESVQLSKLRDPCSNLHAYTPALARSPAKCNELDSSYAFIHSYARTYESMCTERERRRRNRDERRKDEIQNQWNSPLVDSPFVIYPVKRFLYISTLSCTISSLSFHTK